MVIDNIIYLRVTVRLRIHVELRIPIGLDRMATKNGEQNRDERPHRQDCPNGPGSDPELLLHTKYPVQEEKQGDFGECSAQNVKIGIDSAHLLRG